MEREYLPGEVRDRIKDLMKERKVNQSELARMAGCNKSTISRFLSGQTDTLVQSADPFVIGLFFVSAAQFLRGSMLGDHLVAFVEKLSADVTSHVTKSLQRWAIPVFMMSPFMSGPEI